MKVFSNEIADKLIWPTILILALGAIWFLPWRFQTNDDVIMMWLVSGAYTGTPEAYAVFIHPFISWIFSKFYTILPEINWYGLAWFAVNASAGCLLFSKIQTLRSPAHWKQFLNMLVMLICIHLCIFPQFTLVAGFSALAGLVNLSRFGTGNAKIRFLGWLLLLLGFLIRWESVVLILLGWSWSEFIFPTIPRNKAALLGLSIGVLGILLIGGKVHYEQKYIDSDFLTFNRLRGKVIDHPVLMEEIVRNDMGQDVDWHFFSRWMFEELPIGTQELQIKKEALDQGLYSMTEFWAGISRIFRIQLTELFKSMLILVLTGTFWSLSIPLRKKALYFLLWLSFFLLFNHFNLLLGRVNLLFFLVLLFPLITQEKIGFTPKVSRISIVILALFLSVHFVNFLREAHGRKIINREFLTLLAKKPKDMPLFVEGFFEYNFSQHYSWQNPTPILSYGWISRSPWQEKAYHLRGFSKPSKLTEYALLAFQLTDPLVFPDYMDRISSGFELVRKVESQNLLILEYALIE